MPPPGCSQRRIVCAAVQYPGNILLVGARHFDKVMLGQFHRLRLVAEEEEDTVQGFIDQYGDFFNRRDAFKIAEAANQIIRRVGGDEGKLFSENLY